MPVRTIIAALLCVLCMSAAANDFAPQRETVLALGKPARTFTWLGLLSNTKAAK